MIGRPGSNDSDNKIPAIVAFGYYGGFNSRAQEREARIDIEEVVDYSLTYWDRSIVKYRTQKAIVVSENVD